MGVGALNSVTHYTALFLRRNVPGDSQAGAPLYLDGLALAQLDHDGIAPVTLSRFAGGLCLHQTARGRRLLGIDILPLGRRDRVVCRVLPDILDGIVIVISEVINGPSSFAFVIDDGPIG